MKSTVKRVAWIDNAKFFAIVCVVLGHSFSLIQGFKGYDEINLFIVAFNMPLFAMVSGMTSYRSLIKITNFTKLIDYFNKISWRIGIPTVIYTLIAMAIGYGMQMRMTKCIISFTLLIIVASAVYLIGRTDNSYYLKNQKLWGGVKTYFPYLVLPICLINQSVWYFVYLLMMLYAAAVSSYVANLAKLKFKLVVFCTVFFLLSLLIAPFSPFLSLIELFLPFITGFFYSLKNGLGIFLKDSKVQIFVAVCLILIGIGFFIYYYSIPNQFYLLDYIKAYKGGQFDIIMARQFCAVLLSFAIILLIQVISRKYSYIATFGAMTFGIYTIHSEIIGILRFKFPKYDSGVFIQDILLVITVCLGLLFISIILVRLIRKSSYLKLILLGE